MNNTLEFFCPNFVYYAIVLNLNTTINITCKVLKTQLVGLLPTEILNWWSAQFTVFSNALEPRVTVLMLLNWHTLIKILSTVQGRFKNLLDVLKC